jgi:PKD repeat protein
MNDKLNIEDIFKEKFENFSQVPQKNVWNYINRKLAIKSFLKFNLLNFNIYYVGIITSALIISGSIMLNSENNKITIKDNVQKEITTIQKQTENNVEAENVPVITQKDIKKNNSVLDNNQKVTNEIHSNKSIVDKTIIENVNNIESQNSIVKNENTTIGLISKAEFSADNYSGCAPITVNFTNVSENCIKYRWDFGNGTKSNEANPNIIFENAGKYKVKLFASSEKEDLIYERTIIIYEKPKANLIVSNKNDLFTGDEIYFTNTSISGNKYLWKFGDGTNSETANPVHKYEKSGNYSVKLIAISEKSCIDSSEIIKIAIKETKYKVSAPNAFTPSLDGPKDGNISSSDYSNDIFAPIFISDVAEFKLRIFNRRGILVFESTNPKFGWNGYYRNEISPSGVYVWECSGKFIDGENFSNSGDLTLIYSK